MHIRNVVLCNAKIFLCNYRIYRNKHICYALVVCSPPPPPPASGNSGDFDFWSSKSLLKAPSCGDCSMVEPLLFPPPPQPAIFSFQGPFCLYKANPGYFHHTAMAILWSKPHSFPRLSPALLLGLGGPWLQMTSALNPFEFIHRENDV